MLHSITLTQEEVDHIYLAVAHAIVGNINNDAVRVFKQVMDDLATHASEITKLAADIKLKYNF